MSRLTVLLLIAASVGAWHGSDSSPSDGREPAPLATRVSAPIAFIRGNYFPADFPRDLVVVSPTGVDARVLDGPRLDVRGPRWGIFHPNRLNSNISWSPNGRRIVFSAALSFDVDLDLYVVNADGSRRRRLTRMLGNEIAPAWSPRGDKIVFERENDADRSIWVINADGSRPRKLTSGFGRGFEYPAWSPRGRKIAFGQLGSGWIYVMNADGSKPHRVARGSQRAREHSYAPKWSPAGKVAFFSNGQIWLVNPDGSRRRRALREGTKSHDSDFQWSPDGRTIAFVGLGITEGDDEILLANAAGGTTFRRLTDNQLQDRYPSWSPDGKALALLRYRDDDDPDAFDVYVINADGTGERNLTNSAAVDETRPVWSPSPR